VNYGVLRNVQKKQGRDRQPRGKDITARKKTIEKREVFRAVLGGNGELQRMGKSGGGGVGIKGFGGCRKWGRGRVWGGCGVVSPLQWSPGLLGGRGGKLAKNVPGVCVCRKGELRGQNGSTVSQALALEHGECGVRQRPGGGTGLPLGWGGVRVRGKEKKGNSGSDQ